VRNNRRLANRIELRGVTMPSCGHCQKHSLVCVVSVDSNSCSNCVRRQRKNCDAKEISEGAFLVLDRERERLDAAWASAQSQALLAAQSQQQAWAKMARVEKLKGLLAVREGELIRRGVKTIEELEKLEEEERLEKERAGATAKSVSDRHSESGTPGHQSLPDDHTVVFSSGLGDPLSPSFLQGLGSADWGFLNETVEPGSGTS
jgi:hypothetical protein